MFQKLWFRNTVIVTACVLSLYLLFVTRSVLAPVFIALAIAYALDPIIDRFERWNISRTWGIVLLCSLILLGMTGLSLYLVPQLLQQVHSLAESLPIYWEKASASFMPYLQNYLNTHPVEIEGYKNSFVDWLRENGAMLTRNILSGIGTSFISIGNFLGNLLSLVIIPVFAFYLLRDFDLITSASAQMIPLKQRAWVVNLMEELDLTMRNFIKGQLLVALILSVIYSIGLWIADCPAFLLIGIIAGFANLIPYLGLVLGFAPALFLTYISGNPTWQVVTAGMTFVVGQMLEGMVITPKVIGDSVGLHPAVVLIGLTLGGTYFGFIGMMLALPGTAVVMVLVRRAHRVYLLSDLYRGDEAEDDTFSETAAEDESEVALVAKPKPVKRKPRARR